jgi:hypothetical protein
LDISSNLKGGVSSSSINPAERSSYPTQHQQKQRVSACQGDDSNDGLIHQQAEIGSGTLNLSSLQQLEDPKRMSERMQEYIGGLLAMEDGWAQGRTVDGDDEVSDELRAQQVDNPPSALLPSEKPHCGDELTEVLETTEEEMLQKLTAVEVGNIWQESGSAINSVGVQHVVDAEERSVTHRYRIPMQLNDMFS